MYIIQYLVHFCRFSIETANYGGLRVCDVGSAIVVASASSCRHAGAGQGQTRGFDADAR